MRCPLSEANQTTSAHFLVLTRSRHARLSLDHFVGLGTMQSSTGGMKVPTIRIAVVAALKS
jgi:hypothetical protein